MSQNSREFLIILKITSTEKITGEDVSSQRVLFGLQRKNYDILACLRGKG